MTSKRLSLLIVVAALAVANLPLSAQHSPQLNGKYASTGETSCLFSSLGFNSDLTPVSGSVVYLNSITSQGSVTFNGNGTGTVQAKEVSLMSTTPPHASGDDESFSFTYSTNSDGGLLFQPGTVSGTILAGPGRGDTFTIVNVPSQAGQVSPSGTVVLTSTFPTIEIFTQSGGSPTPRICHRTRVLVPVN
jgi:hypothetical protein